MGGTGSLILAFVLSLSLYEDAQIWAICLHPGRNSIAYGLSAWPGQPHSRAAAARCQPKPADEGGCALDSVYLQTPLHMAIAYNHPDVVSVILEQKGK